MMLCGPLSNLLYVNANVKQIGSITKIETKALIGSQSHW